MPVSPWTLIEAAEVPGSGEPIRLLKRGTEFSIRLGKIELMNSRTHGSEDELARLACARIAERARPKILTAGLGMGFTLRAALDVLPADAQIVVAELVPQVIGWNRQHFTGLAGDPIADPRVELREADVAALIEGARGVYDAIILDVDNGPEGATPRATDRLFGKGGLQAAHAALRPGGAYAVWSASPDPLFSPRVRKAGFTVEELQVRAHAGGGSRHTIWIAVRADR